MVPGEEESAAPLGAPSTQRKNICCVGDDDQSIYGWRGAEVDNILRFEHDFPGAKSSGWSGITEAPDTSSPPPPTLSRITRAGLARRCAPRTCWAKRSPSPPAWDSEEEAREHRRGDRRLPACRARAGEDHPLDEIAILVRASFQMREFEDRFIQLGLPYRVIGGPRFYERMEIRDALAYLRVIPQPADDLAFERIVNTPKRGLGDAAVQMLHDYRAQEAHSADEAAAQISSTDEMKPKPRNSLRDADGGLRALARGQREDPAYRARRDRARRSRATPRCGRRTAPPTPPAGWRT